jgi:alpha-glucosidase
MKTRFSGFFPIVVAMIATFIFTGCAGNESNWEVTSPNGKINVIVSLDKTDGSIYYIADLHVDGKVIRALDRSSLGLVRNDMDFSKNLKFKSYRKRNINEPYSTISGKRINDVNHCQEITIGFENNGGEIMDVIFRAYNEGLAYRYHFPVTDTIEYTVIDELSSFNLNTTSGKAWMQTYDTLRHWSLAYEIPYEREIPIGTSADVSYGWALPLLFEKDDGTWIFVSEADLDEHYAGIHVKQHAPGGNYMLEFPEEYECYGLFSRYPSSTLPWTTPWRFAIISDRLGDIVESNIVDHLSRSTEYEDTDWIQPGISSWSWWYDPSSSMDYIPLKDHVDLSKEMAWRYSLVDADWDIMVNGDIDQLIDYAHEQGVELFIWYNSGGPNNRVMWYFNLTDEIANRLRREGVPARVFRKLDPIINVGFFPETEYFETIHELLGESDFDRYGEQIILAARNLNARPRDRFYEEEARVKEFQFLRERGVRGIKIDFFASDKQEIIKMYISIFREAAKNEILINTHGCTIPRGWTKTFPNLLTMEAVMGAEMYGWSGWPQLAPIQNTIYPFIRDVIGPTDYTPFTLSTRLGGYPRITSNAHELALTVHYETGLLHVAEWVDHLRKMPYEIIQFLKDVPVVWDDIHFMDGYPGDYSVLARRSGSTYYISGINGKEEKRNVSFIPDFLEPGTYKAMYYLDGKEKQSFGFDTKTITYNEKINIEMIPFGGFVIVIDNLSDE